MCCGLVRNDVALVQPHLDANATRAGACFTESVINVCTKCVQWNATFAVPLGAAHFCATQTTRTLNTNTKCAELLCVLHRALHCTTECDAINQLVSNTLCDESSVEFCLLDFNNVELQTVVAGDLCKTSAKLVCLCTLTTDNNSGTCGVHVDAELVTCALYFNTADCCVFKCGHEVLTDLPILSEIVLVLTLGEPAALPIGGDSETEAVWIDLLAHQLPASSVAVSVASSAGASTVGSSTVLRLAATRARRLLVGAPFAIVFASRTASCESSMRSTMTVM